LTVKYQQKHQQIVRHQKKRELVDRSMLKGESIELFRSALRNENTRDPYERHLVTFLNYVSMEPDAFVTLARKNQKAVEKILIQYVNHLVERVERRELAGGTIRNPIKVVRLLLEMNDIITINWRRIRRLLPTARGYAMDRIPTMEEVREIYDNADLRGRALTLVLFSSGIREGAIESLEISDWSPIYRDEKLVAGRLVVYNGEPERYTTFITQEANIALEKYLEFRRDHGEELNHNSPLFRDKFDPIKGQTGNSIIEPMTAGAVRQYYNRLLHSIGIRKDKQRRHQFSVHGFRKAYKTICELGGMKPIIIEILLNHTTGISDSYFRPTESQLLDDYLLIHDKLCVSVVADLAKLRLENEHEIQQLRKTIAIIQKDQEQVRKLLQSDKFREALLEKA
jgi:site-specific recombinase XerC